MATHISPLSVVHPHAELGEDVVVGPFCTIGPDVVVGDGCRLDSHVVLTGRTAIGANNRFFPGTVIGGEPQDYSYRDSDTRLTIGDNNVFREGVTINRGAEKEDHTTRIGNNNMFMANSHAAHNCRIGNNVILVNGVLLGGHVHVHDYAIISGNTVVHHFTTVGTVAFVSGGCRVTRDIPPYMLAAGSDVQRICTINLVGMQRRGFSKKTIAVLKRAYRLLFREHKPLDAARDIFHQELDGNYPIELTILLNSIEQQQHGKMGRAREAFRHQHVEDAHEQSEQQRRRAA